jgi:DNA-binding LacI/PurR family transcriptional regulator
MAALLDRGHPPDAVFCFNDTLALGALWLLAERGVRVPEEVAVIGLDDIQDGRFSVPRLSTVGPDKEFLARTAVRMLGERLGDGGSALAPRDVRAGFELVVRGSTVRGPALTAARARG